MSLRFGAYLDLNVKTGGFHTLHHRISIILDKMVFLDPLRTGLTNSEFSLTRVALSGQRI